MKARYSNQQEAVSVTQIDNKDFVFINLNETIVTEKQEGSEVETTSYEYDYNEIVAETGVLDLDDIRQNPDLYLDYTVPNKTLETKLEEQGLMLQYIALMSGIEIPEV